MGDRKRGYCSVAEIMAEKGLKNTDSEEVQRARVHAILDEYCGAPASVPSLGETPPATKRCPVCSWPLYDRVEDGCTPGNCSMRPYPHVSPAPALASLGERQPRVASKRARDLVANHEMVACNLRTLGAGELGDAERMVLDFIAGLETEVASLRSALQEARDANDARMAYLFDALGFPTRHRWGGDVREFTEGIDASIRNLRMRPATPRVESET